MKFDPNAYGPAVADILKLDGSGERLMPLASGRCSSAEALAAIQGASAKTLFPQSRAPEAALSGLYLYFSCMDEAHQVAQTVHTPDGAFWHGIVHRQEPDPGNARYWFRQVGSHPIFRDLAGCAQALGLHSHDEQGGWDPFRFIEICGQSMRVALETQRAEWQLLFDYCARGDRL